MIAKLKGIIDDIGEESLVIDVGGVGYEVFCPGATLAGLPARGEAVALVIFTHVREDRIQLFGFASQYEKEWFLKLQSVQGVGARLAMAILSALSPEQLAASIVSQDAKTIATAPGVGAKLAARIANELKDKVPSFMSIEPASSGSGDKAASEVADAVSALVNLGYTQSDAYSAVVKASREQGGESSVEDLIRLGLRELSA